MCHTCFAETLLRDPQSRLLLPVYSSCCWTRNIFGVPQVACNAYCSQVFAGNLFHLQLSFSIIRRCTTCIFPAHSLLSSCFQAFLFCFLRLPAHTENLFQLSAWQMFIAPILCVWFNVAMPLLQRLVVVVVGAVGKLQSIAAIDF